MDNIYKELSERKLVTEKQFGFLEAIRTKKIVSLYYELRLILYLGIMLLSGGVGYFAYQNMGIIGHLLSMFLLGVAIIVGFNFIKKFAKPYTNLSVTIDLIYFDYILILVSLLVISLITYIEVYFNLVNALINWTSFFSAALLLFMAYRYDNRALLSMGITALAAAVGISISLVDWAKGDWSFTSNLYVISILLGVFLIIAEQVTYRYGIKKHFRFTFQNFGLILFFVGCIAALSDRTNGLFYALLMFVSAGILTYYTWREKEFLFFLYSNIAGYIALTYLVFKMIDRMDNGFEFYLYYFPITCISYIVFLIKKKSHFAND
jgi:hypothetical protein